MITKNDTVFIPISLGNHYYSTKVLEFIKSYVLPLCSNAQILICDQLRVIIYKMRNVGSHDFISAKVDKEVAQFKRTLNNCGIPNKTTEINTWELVSDSLSYHGILSNVEALVANNPVLRDYVHSLANKLIIRFLNSEQVNAETLLLQKFYIIEETAISLYMTEIYGAQIELYRREEEGLIKYLYKYHTPELKEILHKPVLNRTFISLESIYC
ncbi:hypothetical protein SG34_011770 [Thalassomonas viridans]|uniref:Cyclodipeptide synthase n=1 Tax=Thalassomonas viridans TaxID=137584 RepID=A0AAE9Z6B3_9GAMM|nr:hypothetical protein [Thalassomonas viridans]WDE07495.1 hypothetical protein SG34_011770 [Thalassomonas viridans]